MSLVRARYSSAYISYTRAVLPRRRSGAMLNNLLFQINERYPLNEIDTGEFSTLKANGMRFTIRAYHAEGLGHVSVMSASGFFGLMRMETVMIVPKERDLPLYSYDRIHAMGNDVLIVELYDTLLAECDLSALSEAKAKYSFLTERDPGEHWYDDIKLPESISKKGKKRDKAALDALATEHLTAYLSIEAGEVTDIDKKRELSLIYVDGLLTRGGPSTDVFKKSLGIETTTRLFKTVLFGTDLT